MLENTFLHIPGIGVKTEQDLWACGVHSWQHASEIGPATTEVRPRTRALLDAHLPRSRQALDQRDAAFFARLCTLGEAWRAYPHFDQDCVFLDIETTGLSSAQDEVTLVGLYDGRTYTALIAGQNLAALAGALQRYRVVVTFNGACFDLRFLRAKWPTLPLPAFHIDLRGVTRRLGLTGGLKVIERRLGLARDPATAHLDGFDAVLLWRRYQRGDRTALDLLIQYNTEDVIHLKTIMESCYRSLRVKLPLP